MELNGSGDIVGGHFYQGSGTLDLLWFPLRPKPSGAYGNRRGNSYVSVEGVLAMWRESVPEEARQRRLVVDPPIPDQLSNIHRFRSQGKLVPIQYAAPRVIVETTVPDGAPSSDDESVPDSSAGR